MQTGTLLADLSVYVVALWTLILKKVQWAEMIPTVVQLYDQLHHRSLVSI